jgi:hypothetical protein
VVTVGLYGIHQHGGELGIDEADRHFDFLDFDPQMRQMQACAELLRHGCWVRMAPADTHPLNPD